MDNEFKVEEDKNNFEIHYSIDEENMEKKEREYRLKDKPKRGREYDRQSGTGRGKEIAKGGAGGKGTWGDNPENIAKNYEKYNDDDYYFESALNQEKRKERRKRKNEEDNEEENKAEDNKEEKKDKPQTIPNNMAKISTNEAVYDARQLGKGRMLVLGF